MGNSSKRWPEIPIGDLCNLTNGRAFKVSEWGKKGLPIIRIQNLNKPNAGFNFFAGELDPRHLVSPGDLLFAWSGTPGTSFGAHVWKGDKAALNQHIFKVEYDRDCIDGTFLRHAINQKLDELIDSAQGGVGLRHITKGTFEKTLIAIPPYEEQQRIALLVESTLDRVHRMKGMIDSTSKLLGRFRKSVMSLAVSGQLTGAAGGPNNPSAWPEVNFSSIAIDLKYGSAQKCTYGGGPTPVLRIPNIGSTRILHDDLKSANFSASEIEKLSLKIGDVLMVRSNGSAELVGKSAIVRESEQGMLFAGYLIRARLDMSKADPDYINLWLKSPSTRDAIESMIRSTSGVKNINSREIGALPFAAPPLSEQTAIARRVEQLFATSDQIEAKLSAARNRIDSVAKGLLAKAFKGQLSTHDPNDEPAHLLLERIRKKRGVTPTTKGSRTGLG